MNKALEERRREQERLLALAESYIRALSTRLDLLAAVVVGSVARGDFNVWSDVDVVVVAKELPHRVPDRGALLAFDSPAPIQPVGFTPEELQRALVARNPLAIEAVDSGVVLVGEPFLRSYRD